MPTPTYKENIYTKPQLNIYIYIYIYCMYLVKEPHKLVTKVCFTEHPHSHTHIHTHTYSLTDTHRETTAAARRTSS